MLTVSPPASPSVVARTLMIQKPSVTAGTLLRVLASMSLSSKGRLQGHIPVVTRRLRHILQVRPGTGQQVVMVVHIVRHPCAERGRGAAARSIRRLMHDLGADMPPLAQVARHH